MVCRTIQIGDTYAIVCGPRGRNDRRRCSVCGRPAFKLCDFPRKVPEIREGQQRLVEKTCDAPLCARCAVSPDRHHDYCPTHDLSAVRGTSHEGQRVAPFRQNSALNESETGGC